MAAMLLAACSEEAAVTGQPGDDAMQQLTFDITETSWDGENINVTTRSGETLEGLRITTKDLSWNFETAVPVADVAALNASQSAVDPNTRLWTYDAGTTYTSAAAFDGYLKGGEKGTTELTFTQGLRFAAAAGDIKIVNNGANSYIRLKGAVTISGLKAGQTVTVIFASASAEDARTLTYSNLAAPSGFVPAAESPTRKTGTGMVAANGNVTFMAEEEIDIYSINIPKAVDEGFGLYCPGLSIENTQVTWNDVSGQWHIGENNYPTYWRQADSGTLDIYAYAPYKASPTYPVTSGVLTFTAQVYGGTTEHEDKLSGSNVDLLYAGEKGYARNSGKPVALNFKHALAKLTFGTITNNTGVTLKLTGFTITGNINKSADLNLATGKWSNHVKTGTGYTITTPPPFVTISIPPLADKETTFPPMPNREMLFIPDAPVAPDTNGKITLNVKINSESASENFNFDVELEQGKNKTLNITVEKNFEVVIEE